MIKLNNDKDFKDIIKEGLWLVDFSATWCGPCRMLEPNLEELSKDNNVLQVDIDKFQVLTESFNIMSVPTLLVFNNGELVNQSVGYKSLEDLRKLMK